MTPFQLQLLDFIRSEIETYGISPSYDRIAHCLGRKSRGSIFTAVQALVRDGQLVKRRGKVRALSLPNFDLANVPTAALRIELDRRERVHG